MKESEEAALRRARQASDLMENEALQKAFSAIESHYIEAWMSSSPTQSELRDQAYMQLFALQQFRRQLQTFLETGKILSAAQEQNQTS